MKNKIKFINIKPYQYNIKISKNYQQCEPPLSYKNLPDGEYLIRGDKKYHSKKYFKINDIWYLIEDKTKDNGHYYCICTEYILFPNLSKKEWDTLNSIKFNKLTKVWQRYRWGYNFWMELREIRRNARKKRIKLIGR